MTYAWVTLEDGRQVYRKQVTTEPKRSSFPCPMLALDTMPETRSMATGEVYTSKAALRSEYKSLGMVEVGNDPARLRPRAKPKIDRAAIKSSLEKAEARFNRGERVT